MTDILNVFAPEASDPCSIPGRQWPSQDDRGRSLAPLRTNSTIPRSIPTRERGDHPRPAAYLPHHTCRKPCRHPDEASTAIQTVRRTCTSSFGKRRRCSGASSTSERPKIPSSRAPDRARFTPDVGRRSIKALVEGVGEPAAEPYLLGGNQDVADGLAPLRLGQRSQSRLVEIQSVVCDLDAVVDFEGLTDERA